MASLHLPIAAAAWARESTAAGSHGDRSTARFATGLASFDLPARSNAMARSVWAGPWSGSSATAVLSEGNGSALHDVIFPRERGAQRRPARWSPPARRAAAPDQACARLRG